MRLLHLLYLVDWKHTIVHGQPMTTTRWELGARGPYSKDIDCKTAYAISDTPVFTPTEEAIVQFVVNATKLKSETELNKLIYSTYPVLTGNKFCVLVSSARAYKAIVADCSEDHAASGPSM